MVQPFGWFGLWHGLAQPDLLSPGLASPLDLLALALAWPGMASPGLAWAGLAELLGIAAGTSSPTCNPSISKGKVLIFLSFPLKVEGLQVGLLAPAAIPWSSAGLGQVEPGQARPGHAMRSARPKKRPDEARPGQAKHHQRRPASLSLAPGLAEPNWGRARRKRGQAKTPP